MGSSHESARIVSIADTHFEREKGEYCNETQFHNLVNSLSDTGDIFIHAGDIVDDGSKSDIDRITSLFTPSPSSNTEPIPRLAVLGNHDFSARNDRVRHSLKNGGIMLLDELDEPYVFNDNGSSISFVGAIGFGCGYFKKIQSLHFGSTAEFDDFTKQENARLESQIQACSTEYVVGVFHFPPILPLDVPRNEYRSSLNEIVEDSRLDLVIHGHIHQNNDINTTPNGISLKNVAVHTADEGQIHTVVELT